MPGVPNRFTAETTYPNLVTQLNDNMDKVVSDVSDLGAKFSSGYASYSVTIPAGGMHSQLVGVLDNRPQYQPGKVQIVPRCEAFVDTDGDDNYLLGYGASLSAEQLASMKSVTVERRASVGAVASLLIQIRNFGAVSHTYYVRTDDSYMNSPATGSFR